MSNSDIRPASQAADPGAASMLNESLIAQIERALHRVGAFGEVRLRVAKGRLRFIEVVQSEQVQDGFRPEACAA